MDLQITHKTSSTKAAVQKKSSTDHIFLLDWQEVDFRAEENVPFEQQSQEFVVKVKSEILQKMRFFTETTFKIQTTRVN